MTCFNPMHAHRLPDGRVVFVGTGKIGSLLLPCRQCAGCRLDHSLEWATRCMHESQMHSDNSFITLTFAPQHLPPLASLEKKYFQDFMKRLRKRYPPRSISYYMCGEYGETNPITGVKDGGLYRPHYHAIIFGAGFSDRKFLRRSPSGFLLYSSEELSSLWPFGHASIGDVTFESCAYVARYVMKKRNGDPAFKHYAVIDPETGEILGHRLPEYTDMSKKPAIGLRWLEKFDKEVYPRDAVLVNSHMRKTPRHYDTVYAKHFPDVFADIKQKRVDKHLHSTDNTRKRLAVKAEVAAARVSLLKRSLKD